MYRFLRRQIYEPGQNWSIQNRTSKNPPCDLITFGLPIHTSGQFENEIKWQHDNLLFHASNIQSWPSKNFEFLWNRVFNFISRVSPPSLNGSSPPWIWNLFVSRGRLLHLLPCSVTKSGAWISQNKPLCIRKHKNHTLRIISPKARVPLFPP